MHLSFHPLTIASREPAAEDAVCLTLEVPEALRGEYQFEPGQHVALRATLGGREVRRTYSIVNGAPDGELRLGIRVQPAGGLSHFLAHEAKLGDRIDALSPTGRFIHSGIKGRAGSYVAFAAGSGISPVLSIATAVLEQEPESQFLLVYGNRTSARTMFLEDILALKNRFVGRFAVHFIMSREPQDIDVFNGRVDAAKIQELAGVLFDPATVDEVFICGPGDMAASTREALRALGTTAPIHFERFTTAEEPAAPPVDVGSARDSPAAVGDAATVTVIQDGRRRSFTMLPTDQSVLDAAARAGLDLPFSCRAGVCSTCRAKVVSGAVTMAHNVALEDWELAAGFVLCCQSRPTSRELELSYDEK
ncbi:MAG TPA: 2Fe-2S iron-sulfur cluster-binding protein [Steroidobacteraceae bacterium]|nr:2Fe-2S iron-sulfur cluster-binding protein [Steroidobacteraceae bacterium]